jgi:GNAT superfamily N-acetyltransferase
MNATAAAEFHFRAHVHHHNHYALVAVNVPDGCAVGAARYVRRAQDHASADLEVAVDQAWQGRGVGTELLRRLVDQARSNGIERIVIALPAQAGPLTVERTDAA